jgi:hypothetical protein
MIKGSEDHLNALAKGIVKLWTKVPPDVFTTKVRGGALGVRYGKWEDAEQTIRNLEKRVVLMNKHVKLLEKNTSVLPPAEVLTYARTMLGEGLGIPIVVSIVFPNNIQQGIYTGSFTKHLGDDILREYMDSAEAEGRAPPGCTFEAVKKEWMEMDGAEKVESQRRLYERFKTTCASCRATGLPLQQCSKCGMSRYCGKECQLRDWTLQHKRECNMQRRAWSILVSDREAAHE